MGELIIIIILLFSLILLKFGLNVQVKEIFKLKNRKNNELDKITKSLPSDEIICKEILVKLENNSNIIIKKDEKSNDCLYLVFNNSILLGKFKTDFIRVQTIAHECIHSVQNKFSLWFNFIFSNFYIIYFIIISMLTILNKINNTNLQIILLLIFGIIQYSVRTYLEIEAMSKAPFVAKEYLINQNISNENVNQLLKEYNYINSIGIPFMNYYLIFKNLLKVMIYCICILI